MSKSNFTRTWWGDAFLSTIEEFTDTNRLQRGRRYANSQKVKSFNMEGDRVVAKVRGSVNPYYGVHKEPLYTTELEFEPISRAKWAALIAIMASRVSILSKLLTGEIPDNIEDCFETLGLHLLPRKEDFVSQCSCPDWSNPCKHIAGVYYLIAAELDRDPLILFALRGLSKADLHTELAKTPLGMALSKELVAEPEPPKPVESLHTQPQTTPPSAVSLTQFWQGEQRLPNDVETPQPTNVPAILIKKQGDFPPFWQRDNSFIEVMEDFYTRVRTKNGSILD
ncbi:SWIM zinc finger family protein [cf. Phormidesmis sp. LEGE 11477]|uniref:SWIM zinc finger family protein n=1 Tax=cf. Phormidesmis sp. LEGE 11477 TaxID=1828680 RepID=UPI001880EC3A|nr:SWIM zinc finger family protein [cf. Phormidesmis sp. LEGE 11477]MBE9064852.1 SWIM zinc finger family protein [cf. Phormidesmis sp. LEGE 11477]